MFWWSYLPSNVYLLPVIQAPDGVGFLSGHPVPFYVFPIQIEKLQKEKEQKADIEKEYRTKQGDMVCTSMMCKAY